MTIKYLCLYSQIKHLPTPPPCTGYGAMLPLLPAPRVRYLPMPSFYTCSLFTRAGFPRDGFYCGSAASSHLRVSQRWRGWGQGAAVQQPAPHKLLSTNCAPQSALHKLRSTNCANLHSGFRPNVQKLQKKGSSTPLRSKMTASLSTDPIPKSRKVSNSDR